MKTEIGKPQGGRLRPELSEKIYGLSTKISAAPDLVCGCGTRSFVHKIERRREGKRFYRRQSSEGGGKNFLPNAHGEGDGPTG